MSSICSTNVSASTDSTSKSEHQKLASIVKAVHAKLRRKYKKDRNFNELWTQHVKNKDLLSEYAEAMHHLAVDHWSKHPETRIDWCRSVCLRFFIHGELEKVLEKDTRRRAFKGKKPLTDTHAISNEPPTDTMVERKSNVNNSNDTLPEQDLNCGEANGMLGNSLDDLQDASNLMEAKYSSKDGGRQLVNSNSESSLPVVLNDEKQQPSVSKVEEYLGRLDISADPEDCLNAMRDSADSCQDPLDQDAVYSKYGPATYNIITPPVKGKLRLLDVGSCYNPFLVFEEFVAIGVDISPAVKSVFTCDFLNLEMLEPVQLAQDTHDSWLASLRSPIARLPKDCFHVVVFSLLLEYFPSAYQRWLCCQKAHQLLMMNGLLLIITPDSHSVNRGAPQMKSWKVVIESLGFKRYKYEKQDHLHCMAFRKVTQETEIALLNGITPDMLFIPQDFNNADSMDDEDFLEEPRSEGEDKELYQNFLELPEFDIF